MIMAEKTCRFCKYTWTPRRANPVCCPRCKRYDWNKSMCVVLYDWNKKKGSNK